HGKSSTCCLIADFRQPSVNFTMRFRVIRQRGLRIPEDVSLITFHDADWTSVTTPPITVVDQPVYALGKSVAELLIRRLKGETRPAERLVLPTGIIERGSVGPPSNRAP
uniref:substrate-binding domain-containing protein n=2 Tax=Mesorhizobium TaxID=68287 RepID=UPI0010A95BB7